MLLPYGSQDGLRGSSLKTCFQSGTRMQSYPHIGLQRKGCQIFAEGGEKVYGFCAPSCGLDSVLVYPKLGGGPWKTFRRMSNFESCLAATAAGIGRLLPTLAVRSAVG